MIKQYPLLFFLSPTVANFKTEISQLIGQLSVRQETSPMFPFGHKNGIQALQVSLAIEGKLLQKFKLPPYWMVSMEKTNAKVYSFLEMKTYPTINLCKSSQLIFCSTSKSLNRGKNDA